MNKGAYRHQSDYRFSSSYFGLIFSPQAKHHYYIFTVKMLFRQVPSNVVCVLKYNVNKERCLKA